MSMQEEREILAALIKEIESAAEEEIKKIMQEAEREKERILQEAEKRAIEEKRKKEEELKRKIRMEILRELSLKRISARKEYLINKYKIILSLINELRDNVNNIVNKRERIYIDGLINLMEEAILKIKSKNVIVFCNKEDLDMLEKSIDKISDNLKKHGIEKEIKIEPLLPSDEYGVIAMSEDEKEYYINTISSRTEYFISEYLPILLKKE